MKSSKFLIGICLLALPACTTAQPSQSLQAGQTAARFEHAAAPAFAWDYLIYIPKTSAAAPQKKFPAIIFLHGSGERGTNVWDVAKHGPPKIVKDQDDFPFIVLSPQCPPKQHWEAAEVWAFVKEMKQRYPLDENRIYLTGLSMGGGGTWTTLIAHPDLFAAAVPICGPASTNLLANVPPDKMEILKHIPIRVFHGAKDPTVPVKNSEDMTAALKALGADVKLTVYPEAVHDSWTQTYTNPELFSWLLSHDRKSNARDSVK
jgi:predicted peptidase